MLATVARLNGEGNNMRPEMRAEASSRGYISIELKQKSSRSHTMHMLRAVLDLGSEKFLYVML